MIKNELSLAYKAPEIKPITVEVRRCMAMSTEDYGHRVVETDDEDLTGSY